MMQTSLMELIVAFWIARGRKESLFRDKFEEMAERLHISEDAVAACWDSVRKMYQAQENPLGVLTFPAAAYMRARELVCGYKSYESNMALVQLYENVAAQAR